MTERAPHVSDIRNQESSIRVDVKEQSKEKKERVNQYSQQKSKELHPKR